MCPVRDGRTRVLAPERMRRGAAVVDGNTVYINSGGSRKVYSCQMTSEGLLWSTLPNSRLNFFACPVPISWGLVSTSTRPSFQTEPRPTENVSMEGHAESVRPGDPRRSEEVWQRISWPSLVPAVTRFHSLHSREGEDFRERTKSF